MKLFLKFIITIVLLATTLSATPARSGLITFTQPDGSEFEGYLKGDAVFHWIESDSRVVLYNGDDKFYYNAVVNAEGSFELTKEKPPRKVQSKSQKVSAFKVEEHQHSVDDNTKKALKRVQQNARKGNHPR
ncbi:MAG: hypothetical protein U9N39_05840 [Campylobacterota bacterium]|nr:hypothetical protein [Campylobacterota bacterium]